MIPTMLLWLAGWSPAHAEAEIQLRTLLPVVMLVDGERARRTGPFKLTAADLEPGSHTVQIKSLLGRVLYEESVDLVDNTVVETQWQNRVLRTVRTVSTDGQPLEAALAADGGFDGASASGIHAVESEAPAEAEDPWPEAEDDGAWPETEEEGPWPEEVPEEEEEPPRARVTKPGEPAPEELGDDATSADGDALAAADVGAVDAEVGAVDGAAVAGPAAAVVEAAAEFLDEAADVEAEPASEDDVAAAPEDPPSDEAAVDEAAGDEPAGDEVTAEVAGEDATAEVPVEPTADDDPADEIVAEGEGADEVADAPAAEEEAVADAAVAVAPADAEASEVEMTEVVDAPEAASPRMRLSLQEGSRIELVHGDQAVRLEVRDGRIVVTDSAGLVLGGE